MMIQAPDQEATFAVVGNCIPHSTTLPRPTEALETPVITPFNEVVPMTAELAGGRRYVR
jgi:hypothetical protein